MKSLDKDSGVPFKIVMLGDVSVGKTCIVNRFLNNEFDNTSATMAASFASKTLTVKTLGE